MTAQEPIIRYEVPGARRFGNYVWGSLMCLGGLGFLVTGISSYFEFPFLSLLKSPNIQFFPQGLVMCFYGVLGLVLGAYIWLIFVLHNTIKLKMDLMALEIIKEDYQEKI